jgi:hypothetical protein
VAADAASIGVAGTTGDRKKNIQTAMATTAPIAASAMIRHGPASAIGEGLRSIAKDFSFSDVSIVHRVPVLPQPPITPAPLQVEVVVRRLETL